MRWESYCCMWRGGKMDSHDDGEERTNRWHRYRYLFTINFISTFFGHHYAHRQENRLYKTASGVSLDVLAAVVWSRDTSWAHTVRSARAPTPHNRSQHIQANTTRGFIQSVLLTMGIMMPEKCWVKLIVNKYLYLCHLLILSSPTLMMHGHLSLS